MPHVALVAMSGFRVREPEMIALGMTLPGLQERGAAIAALPALGLLTLAALNPPGWEASYHEAPTFSPALVQEVLASRPQLVAISALTASILDAYALADAIRGEGVPVVIGGLHVTSMPDEAAAHADAVVVGDGELVWPELLADVEAGTLRTRYRGLRPFDLADSPVPRLDLLGAKDRPRYTLQTSRGCPLACDFCAASRTLGPYRTKPAPAIERELDSIRALRKHACIELADDNTFVARKDHADLLGALKRSGLRWFTESDWRIGERPEILERLADAGCVQVLVGVETLMPRHEGFGAKAAPLPRVMDALHAIQEAGVAVIGCFVVGGDGEDFETMHALGEFLLNCPLADVQLTVQTPFPGSPLRARLQREGRLLPDRSWESCTLFDVAYRPDRLSADQLESGFRNLVKYTFAAEPTRRRERIRRDVWAKRYAGRVEGV